MGVIVTRNVFTGSDSVSGTGAYTQSEKSNMEFEMEFNASFLCYYKELTYNPQKQLIVVEIWTDNLKTVKLFNKDFTYNVGKQLVQTVLTRIIDGLFLNSVFTYNAQKQLVSITRSGTAG